MHRTTLLLAILCLCAGAAHAGKIYKSVDANGNVTYSSRPPANQKTVEVKTRRTHISDQQARDQLENLSERAEARRQNREVVEQDQQASAAELERKAKNCEIARKNLALLQSQKQVQSEDSDGNKFFLSDEARQSKLTQSQSQIAEFCGS